MAANICRGCNTPIEDQDFIMLAEGGVLHAICSASTDHLISRNEHFDEMRASNNSSRLVPENSLSEDVRDFLKTYAAAAENPADLRDRKILIEQLAELGSVQLKGDVLEVSGQLEVDQLAITCLPDKMHVNGEVWIEDCYNLRCLPDFLTVVDDLNVKNCPALQKFGDTLITGGDLRCTGLQNLQALPASLQVQGNLRMSQCNSLITYVHHAVEGNVEIEKCNALKTIKSDAEFRAGLRVYKCHELETLPKHLTVNGNCNLTDNFRLELLPEVMNILGELNLSRTAISCFKTDLHLLGDLTLVECPELSVFEGEYEISGDLCLAYNPLLSHLPENLSVAGILDLENCTGLNYLPASILLTGDLNISGCSLITELPDWVFRLGRQSNQEVRVDVSYSGLREEIMAQLETRSFENLRFITRPEDNPDNETASSVQVCDGHELQPLLQQLRQEPAKTLYIQYQGSAGIDQGGLSRQAFDRALRQFTVQIPDLFCRHNDQLVLQGEREKIVNIPSSSDLGLLLGRIGRLDMGIGSCFHDDFYRDLFHAYNQSSALNPDELKQYFDHSAALLSDGLPKVSYVELLKQHAAGLQASPQAVLYLQETADEHEVRDLALKTGLYMQTAAQMHRSGLNRVYESDVDFKTAIAGFDQLKTAFLNNLQFTGSGRYRAILEDWSRRSIREAGQQQLQLLSQEITGASALGITSQPVTVHLGELSYKYTMFETRSCDYQLSVSDSLFRQLAQNNNYEEFKNAFLNSFTTGFNVG